MYDERLMATTKRALITGITGQDGSYLAELLLEKGYRVYGVVRRLSAPNVWRIQHLLDRITLLQADLLDQLSLIKVVEQCDPSEFYNVEMIECRGRFVIRAYTYAYMQRVSRRAQALLPPCMVPPVP